MKRIIKLPLLVSSMKILKKNHLLQIKVYHLLILAQHKPSFNRVTEINDTLLGKPCTIPQMTWQVRCTLHFKNDKGENNEGQLALAPVETF